MAYCTLAQVKEYLDISTASDDALISSLIMQAQKFIDTYCKREFEDTAGDVLRYFDAERDTVGDTLFLDADLAEITTINNGGTVLTAPPNGDYVTIPRNSPPYDRIRITCDNWWCFTNCPEDAIEVTGKWVYSLVAPADITHACLRLTSFYYRQKDSQVFDTTTVVEAGVITIPPGLPPDVKRILDQYVRRVAV